MTWLVSRILAALANWLPCKSQERSNQSNWIALSKKTTFRSAAPGAPSTKRI